jgi:hypothetical protein
MQQGWPADQDVARLLVNGWMSSPGHRRNILAPYQTVEVGCHGDRSALYCTQLFVRAPARLAADVAYPQPAGGTLQLRLTADAGGLASRVSVGPPNEPGESEGVVWQRGSATIPLPEGPGLYRLRLWLEEPADPSRFRMIPGPYLCVVPVDDRARLPSACPRAQ